MEDRQTDRRLYFIEGTLLSTGALKGNGSGSRVENGAAYASALGPLSLEGKGGTARSLTPLSPLTSINLFGII